MHYLIIFDFVKSLAPDVEENEQQDEEHDPRGQDQFVVHVEVGYVV